MSTLLVAAITYSKETHCVLEQYYVISYVYTLYYLLHVHHCPVFKLYDSVVQPQGKVEKEESHKVIQ